MGEVSGCLSPCQFHSGTYSRVLSTLSLLPRQNNLWLSAFLTTTIADAPGLSWDCHYQPRLVDGWQSPKAGRSRAIGLPYRGQSVAFFISSLLGVPMDFGATK